MAYAGCPFPFPHTLDECNHWHAHLIPPAGQRTYLAVIDGRVVTVRES